MSDKRTDFLGIVQMIMLKHQDNIIGWSDIAGDAVAASHRIPAASQRGTPPSPSAASLSKASLARSALKYRTGWRR